MSYSIFLEPKALVEMQEGFIWYEKQKDGLGDEFIEEIESCYRKLIDNPQRFSYINAIYRRIKTNRFPYVLVYEIDGNVIVIISIRHTKRQPI